MSIYKNQIEDMVYESRRLLEAYTQEYNSCIEGYLMCCKNHGKETYYHTIYQDGRKIRFSINKNTDMIKALARKEYLNQAIKVLNDNIEVLTKAGTNLQTTDICNLHAKMTKAYRRLSNEYFYGDGTVRKAINLNDDYLEGIKRHEEWAKQPYEKSEYKPENKKFMTSAGFKVRSKSELLIVEELINYGVPFRYEEVLRIGNQSFAPDLTFRDSLKERFYWEHAGMMNLPNYVANHKWKMKMYERAEIVPWKNLIVTYDIDGVISVPTIKSIIENEVLPRL